MVNRVIPFPGRLAKGDVRVDPHAALAAAVTYWPSRWAAHTIAAAAAIHPAPRLGAQDWVDVLDRLERAIAVATASFWLDREALAANARPL
jgi:hypothetical protein